MPHPLANVLVVEDDALLLMAIADELRDEGFVVHEASNADTAIELLELHDSINVIFTDVDMPGSMDGIKLSAAVRRRWPPVKIIVTSGKTLPQAGALPSDCVFMPKPYLTAKVVQTIRSLLHA